MPVTLNFRVWSAGLQVPDLAELAARQQSVTGQRCTFAVGGDGPDGWLELAAIPGSSPETACTLSRSTDPAVVARLLRDVHPIRTEVLHALRLTHTVYFVSAGVGPTDFTLLVEFGLTWALAQMTQGLVAGDTSRGQIEYWWSDAFLAQVEQLRGRVEPGAHA